MFSHFWMVSHLFACYTLLAASEKYLTKIKKKKKKINSSSLQSNLWFSGNRIWKLFCKLVFQLSNSSFAFNNSNIPMKALIFYFYFLQLISGSYCQQINRQQRNYKDLLLSLQLRCNLFGCQQNSLTKA